MKPILQMLFTQRRARRQEDKLLKIRIMLGLHCSSCGASGRCFHRLRDNKPSGRIEYMIRNGRRIEDIEQEAPLFYLLCDTCSQNVTAQLNEEAKKPGTIRKNARPK